MKLIKKCFIVCSLNANTINNLIKGNKMSETFKDNKYIPEVCYYMIVTGEETSELPTMLEKVSTFYEELRTTLLNTIKNFIEPVMIALLAFIVGGIILILIGVKIILEHTGILF